MKNKTRVFGLIAPLSLAALLLAVLLLAGPALAEATRTDFTAWDVPAGDLAGGRIWMDDGYLYMRDVPYTSQIVQVSPAEDLHISGTVNATMNANVDLATGCGHLWGKGSNAGWAGSFQGQICVDAYGNPVSFTTRGVLQGQGELKGLQMRYVNDSGWMTGYVLETPSY